MRRARAGILLAALAVPGAAQAHLANSGLGPFYDGALHLLLSPVELVWLAALGLLAGAQAPAAGRAMVIAAPLGWLLAGALGLAIGGAGRFALANGVGLFLLGAAVALDLRLPLVLAAAVAAGFAGWLGFQGGVELRAAGAGWVALSGSVAVVLALMLLITSLVASARAFALRVACRVLGSWAAATGILSVGWALAG